MKESKQDALSTKDRILDIASELFAGMGFFAVSVRSITSKVGIKESSLYHHFGCKEDILKSIFDRFESLLDDFFHVSGRRREKNDTLDTLDPEAFLKHELKRYISFWNNPAREKLWFVVSLEKYRNQRASELILRQTKELQDFYEICFREWFEKKRLGPYEPRKLAEDYVYSLIAMHSEYRLRRANGKPTRSAEQKMHEFIHFFLERIKI